MEEGEEKWKYRLQMMLANNQLAKGRLRLMRAGTSDFDEKKLSSGLKNIFIIQCG